MTARATAGDGLIGRARRARRTWRLFRNERESPQPYYEHLAEQAVRRLPFALDGRRVLDLGAGPGFLSERLLAEGATVIALEPSPEAVADAATRVPALRADGQLLPFPDASFEAVFCSNVLEHTPDARRVLAEIERVLVPGGWGWVSWTNWLSPWGGHAIAPLHYLGPRLGHRVWRRFLGVPRGPNVPYDGLWPTHIGPTLRYLRARPGVDLVDAVPRYYPSQRWVVRVPGLREFATWNCLLLFSRRPVEPPGR